MALPLPPWPAWPWLAPFAVLPPLARRRPRLAAEDPAAAGLVSVIVPARNEAANIAELLASLCATTYDPVEILVVDDRSDDDTADRVLAVAARDPRVRLVRGAPLPPGWFGKPWACLQGARAARGGLLAFTDADTRHHPELLGRAAGALTRSGAGMLTVVTGQDLHTFWERVVMPHVWVPLGARFYPARVNRARRPREVIANGQFFLATREAYDRAGTHAAVRAEIAEDIVIGQHFFRQGQRVRMWWAEELIRTRMYTGFGHLVEGWSKNLYLGSRASFPDEPVLAFLAPYLVLAGQLFWLAPPAALALGHDWAGWALGLSLLFWTIVAAGMGIPAWYGLTYPLGALMVIALLVRSAWRGERRIEWRGRTYRHAGGAPTARP